MLTDVLGVSSREKREAKTRRLTKASFINQQTLKITSKQLGDFILVGRSKISSNSGIMVAKKRVKVWAFFEKFGDENRSGVHGNNSHLHRYENVHFDQSDYQLRVYVIEDREDSLLKVCETRWVKIFNNIFHICSCLL